MLCLTAFLNAVPALADDDDNRCKTVAGKGVWTLIPAPNDPRGRVLGPTTGDLKSSVSAYLTSLTPLGTLPTSPLAATSVEVWVLGPQDLIIFNGAATFTPIAGQPVGTVKDELTLTAVGGTGAYAGATGTLQVNGIGRNVFGPNAGPGSTYFDVSYRGRICRAR